MTVSKLFKKKMPLEGKVQVKFSKEILKKEKNWILKYDSLFSRKAMVTDLSYEPQGLNTLHLKRTMYHIHWPKLKAKK